MKYQQIKVKNEKIKKIGENNIIFNKIIKEK